MYQGTDRVTFVRSIANIALKAPPTTARAFSIVVGRQLTPAEHQVTLGFSVALKMHNFAELQERISKVETISLDERGTTGAP